MENGDTSQKPISKGLLILNICLVFLVIGMIFLLQSLIKPRSQATAQNTPQPTKHAFDGVQVQAKAVYIYDVAHNEVLYKKNETNQLPLASLTKLMMALVAREVLPDDTRVTIRTEFLNEEGDSGLRPNESWKLKDLLDYSLIVSSNDGARSVASVIGAKIFNTSDFDSARKDFVGKMNARAQSLGLTQTYFVNETGLDQGSVSGGYGSAQDFAELLKFMLEKDPSLLEATKYSTATISSQSESHKARNTNTLIGQIPGLLASKTGYTTLAGGNLAVAFDAGLQRPIIIVVLGSTQDGRFSDVQTLVKASLAYIGE